MTSHFTLHPLSFLSSLFSQGSLLEHLLNFLEPVKQFLQNADALGEIVQTFLLSVRDSSASASAVLKSKDHRGFVQFATLLVERVLSVNMKTPLEGITKLSDLIDRVAGKDGDAADDSGSEDREETLTSSFDVLARLRPVFKPLREMSREAANHITNMVKLLDKLPRLPNEGNRRNTVESLAVQLEGSIDQVRERDREPIYVVCTRVLKGPLSR